ncbi:MAG: FGGY-family carbohydrate kinase [Armatimonadetes bacterium]|nr:FGGY-family carbohydrate kinase [Armatimonadota bacterium]
MKREQLVLGMDVGTQGVRVVAASPAGVIAARAGKAFTDTETRPGPDGRFEQECQRWFEALAAALSDIWAQLSLQGLGPKDVVALAADSTSGTIIPVDASGRPLTPAIMYSDQRSRSEAQALNEAGADFCRRTGVQFGASYGLPKALWLARHAAGVWERTAYVAHAADVIVAWLTGLAGVTDANNALKTGYDAAAGAWPGFIADAGIAPERLPEVRRAGAPVGRVRPEAAAATGLSIDTLVLLGATDGCAEQFSSGAAVQGEWNSVLGSTLVLKGLSSEFVRDPDGVVYCHPHPDGIWMPGGAANTGCRAIDAKYPGIDRDAWNREALRRAPTDLCAYALDAPGERFPFRAPEAVGFIDGRADDVRDMYTATLTAMGFTERLALERLRRLGCERPQRVFTTGGGAASDEWAQIRADAIGLPVLRTASPGAAMGCAVLAAAHVLDAPVREAARRMTVVEMEWEPRPEVREAFDSSYDRWLAALTARGWITARPDTE